MSRIRVAVVDDQALLVSAFVSLVTSADDMVVAGTAANGRQAVQLCAATDVDVALVDVRMPEMDGIEATRHLSALPHPPRVVILTTFNREDYVTDAVLAGASAFLLKDADTQEFLGAIRAVHQGRSVIAGEATAHVLHALRASRQEQATPAEAPAATTDTERLLRRTTAREREVLLLIGAGLSNAEIATTLFVAETTIKTHVSSLLAKLHRRDRVALAVLAHSAGLIT